MCFEMSLIIHRVLSPSQDGEGSRLTRCLLDRISLCHRDVVVLRMKMKPQGERKGTNVIERGLATNKDAKKVLSFGVLLYIIFIVAYAGMLTSFYFYSFFSGTTQILVEAVDVQKIIIYSRFVTFLLFFG